MCMICVVCSSSIYGLWLLLWDLRTLLKIWSNFVYCFHDTILIRLSDGNRTPTDFETRFDFRLVWSHDSIFVESVSKGKIGWDIPKIVLCDLTFNIYMGLWCRLFLNGLLVIHQLMFVQLNIREVEIRCT